MRLSILICAILACLISMPPVHAQSNVGVGPGDAPTADTPFSGVKRDNLLNGLQVVTLEKPEESTVRCFIVIRSGSMYDSVGKTGLVALTQRTLIAVNPRLREELESLQTKVDWGVNSDSTWFYLEAPPNNFESSLEILARLLVVENIRPDAFKRAQTEQIEKIKGPQAADLLADEAFYQAIYGDHPYGHNIDGNEAMVSGMKPGDVYDIFRRFYLANNASAVLVGKISSERSLRAFKILFGGWSKGAIVPPTFRPPALNLQSKLIRIDDPKAGSSDPVELRGGLIGTKFGTPDHIISQLLLEILSQRWHRESSPVAKEIRSENSRRFLAGPITFRMRVPSEQLLGRLQPFTQILNDSFTALTTTPVTKDELAAAKSALIERVSTRSVEEWLRDIETFSLPRNYPLSLRSRIEAVTASDLQAHARKLLEGNSITVVARGRLGEISK